MHTKESPVWHFNEIFDLSRNSCTLFDWIRCGNKHNMLPQFTAVIGINSIQRFIFSRRHLLIERVGRIRMGGKISCHHTSKQLSREIIAIVINYCKYQNQPPVSASQFVHLSNLYPYRSRYRLLLFINTFSFSKIQY